MRRLLGAVATGLLAAVAGASVAPATLAASAATPTVAAASACTVRGPLMGLAPYPGTRLSSPQAFVQLQATNGRGTYAGVSFTSTSLGLSFTVVRRDLTGAVKVLGRFVYLGRGVDLTGRTVRVVGVDATGGVVVAVQRTDSSIGDERLIGIRYDAAGVRHDLTRGPTWSSATPVGVTDSGSVLGDVISGGTHVVVIWRGQGSGTPTVLTAPNHRATAFVANGDWYEESVLTGNASVHLHGDRGVRPLTALDGTTLGQGSVRGASYADAYGVDGTVLATPNQLGVGVHWSPGATTGSAPLVPTRDVPLADVSAVGRSRDVVGVLPGGTGFLGGTRVLRSPTGVVHPLPAEYHPEGDSALTEVVDGAGKVVYTGSERSPMVLTCPR